MSRSPAEQVSTRWLWWTAIFAGGVAPLVAGLKTRERRWITWGAVTLAVQGVGLALGAGSDDEHQTTIESVGVALYAAGWVSGLTFVGAFRDRYRMRVLAAGQVEAREALHTGRAMERERALRLAREDPAEALRRGVGRPDLPDADHGWVVDVNHAPIQVLETLPGVDHDLARRIVAARESIGTVSSVDDLGMVLDLDARTVERLRATAVAVDI